MKITNLNNAADIGASCWLVETDGHRLMLDAGIHPKRDGRDSLPLFSRVQDQAVDAIAVSHCHHDHIGALPVAARHFPSAHVLMTEPSYFLSERVLHNSVNVMVRQRTELGIAEYPLYSHDEVDDIAARFQGYRNNREVEWAALHKSRAGFRSPTLEFCGAGHTLGAAGIMVRSTRGTLFYTGDVSFQDQSILKGACFEDVQADVLIMECTRGNRLVPKGFTRESEIDRLLQTLRDVLHRRGSVLIPSFALGRTQEILGMLALWTQAGALRRQPIYIGGLGRVFTEIYDLEAHRTHRHHSNLQFHEALNLVVLERSQLDSMRLSGGRIFVLTSGMMMEHTAAHDLALRMLGDERHAILFVGYADPDTPGGHLKVSTPGTPFAFSRTAPDIVRRCQMQEFDLTAHANRDELVNFVGDVEPRVVILGHGDPPARAWIASALKQRYPRVRIHEPGPGETVAV